MSSRFLRGGWGELEGFSLVRGWGIPGVSIYKRGGKAASDEDPYILAWFEDGHRRYQVAHPDKGLTKEAAMEISRRLARRRLGLIDPNEAKWIAAAQMPLCSEDKKRPGLLEEYRNALLARSDTAKHALLYYGRLKRIVKVAAAVHLAQLTPANVQSAVAGLTDPKKPSELLSAQTRNHYLQATVCFFQWLADQGYIPANRMARKLRRYNVKNDRRLQRRIISEEQLAKLIYAAEAGPVFIPPRQKNHAIDGPQRADVYRTALAIGCRSNETRTLRVKHLRLQAEAPGILLEGRYSKNHLESFQLISQELAQHLKARVVGKSPDEPVFNLPQRTAEMLRFDLQAAGIPFELDGQRFDFHALRYESGSLAVSRNVNLKVVQERMRHSTITLTMDRYAKPQLHDLRGAAELIPTFLAAPALAQEQRATGTEGKRALQSPKAKFPLSAQRSKAGLSTAKPTLTRENGPTRDSGPKKGDGPAVGGKALTCGLQNRCSGQLSYIGESTPRPDDTGACENPPADAPQNAPAPGAAVPNTDFGGDERVDEQTAAKIALLEQMIEELKKGGGR